MKIKPKLKNILIVVAIVLAVTLIYVFFLKPAPESGSLTSNPTTPATPAENSSSSPSASPTVATQNFLTVLLSVKSLKIDDAIFSDPAFISLHDSSILLVPDGTEGRPNPFAPIGSDILPAAPVVALPPPASPTPPAAPNPPTGGTNP